MVTALSGVRVLEFGGIGPVPFAGMVLADLGASVVRVEPPVGAGLGAELLARGKHLVRIDAKDARGAEVVRELMTAADVVLEGFRPGVVERLGLGPDVVLAANPRVVYVRVTGFGQEGPLAQRAGHDITYLALSGALSLMGTPDHPPTPPANLLADFGSGGMLAVVGALAALLHRVQTGSGGVVDAAMVDGVLLFETMVLGLLRKGSWRIGRAANLLDGGAPFYRTYRCRDGRFIAVGALEPQFFERLVEGLGLRGELDPAWQLDENRWPELTRRFEAAFSSRDRDAWLASLADLDACVAPVLELDELGDEPHLQQRGCFVRVEGHDEPAPAPRFAGTAHDEVRGPRRDPYRALVVGGVEPELARTLVASGVVR